MSDRRSAGVSGRAALAALTAVTLVTVGWWAFALWPAGDATPLWVMRARAVCFGSAASGLPDPAGWMALVLQPLIMFGMLFVIAGDEVRAELRQQWQRSVPRAGLIGIALVMIGAIALTAGRILRAATAPERAPGALTAADVPRVDRPAPPLGLIDQTGRRLEIEDLRGQRTFVTFAFAHCETVCPAVVTDVQRVRRALGDSAAMVIVSLDPWRDVPSRLPAIAKQWHLGEHEYVLSGGIEEVEAVLDAWDITRTRDLSTGDIVHPRLVYVIDSSGRVAFVTPGSEATIAQFASRIS